MVTLSLIQIIETNLIFCLYFHYNETTSTEGTFIDTGKHQGDYWRARYWERAEEVDHN